MKFLVNSFPDRNWPRKGWIVIALVAIGTATFFVAGTIDPQTRYDWIKL